ncbi:MAG: iron-containing alcohol dehydrogenase [Clostridiales bacterium]|jgi:alcohol dehydrogenase YqhD (iron-dependent ADH family)|nr:iron-containing alcohol dehydrogenase [Clostridiales bacterium]MCI2191450.1 iron-containing alcohol dehydrogenase [Oscillospiraceae bacterium]MCI1962336.1 iron-containing alcohol dehydrogenase [Clostridiales bacterium]MCI2022852.1 iron-containing alcohol dehydrogenase [Clostridiales bacterium]MCI2027249.1 iron-containing alcohol dehydrogenase [Clostridiales bacterium]
MKNFDYHIPTDVYFGKGQINKLGQRMSSIAKKVLLVYGGGSIKRIGLYDQIMEQLKQAGITVFELSGVEPNPRIQTVKKGVAICKQEGIEGVLAAGGGSTIDCAKVVSAGACYDGDPWDLVLDSNKIKKVLPIAAILTLAATGSEMDGFAVISDMDKNEKWGTGNELTKPVFSIMDPQYTFSVSKYQTAAGSSDIMSHTFENYFNNTKGAFLQARIAEGILKTIIKYAPIAVEHPDDYEARANLMWASSLAINGLIRYGEDTAWTVHPMEHELSAFYDITHGAGLALLTPYWMEYILSEKTVGKFAEYGVNVWGIDSSKEPMAIAKEAIAKTREFFNMIGMPSHLKELGIDQTHFDIMSEKAANGGLAYGFVPLTKKDVKKIYVMAL